MAEPVVAATASRRLGRFALVSLCSPRHWITAAALAIAVGVFGVLLADSLRYADRLLLRIQIIESSEPPLR